MGEQHPLGRRTRIAVASDRVYVGTADSAFVDVYALEGNRLTSLALDLAPRRPSSRNLSRAIDVAVGQMPDRNDREFARQYLLKAPPPTLLPAYTALFVDPQDILWAVSSAPGDGETRLRALRPDGHIAADLVLPVELTVFEVGNDYVLGRYEDEASGEQFVRAYRFRRG